MPDVRKVLEEKTGLTSRVMDDIYYILEHAHAAHSHPSVRLLTPADEELVLAADRMLWPDSFGNVRKSLQEGVNAGGVIDGRLVSRISSEPPGGRYTSLEAGTIEGWRGQGLATAATTLVARELQRRGLTPVWSTNNANLAPRRVAEKVGFRLFERQATIVFDGLKPYGYQPL
jgi:RimJ/RimL family protein N-acetyltransferase